MTGFKLASRGSSNQEFHVPASGELHFTPAVVTAPAVLVTMYKELLAGPRPDIAGLR